MGDQRTEQLALGPQLARQLRPVIADEHGVAGGLDPDPDLGDVLERARRVRLDGVQPGGDPCVRETPRVGRPPGGVEHPPLDPVEIAADRDLAGDTRPQRLDRRRHRRRVVGPTGPVRRRVDPGEAALTGRWGTSLARDDHRRQDGRPEQLRVAEVGDAVELVVTLEVCPHRFTRLGAQESVGAQQGEHSVLTEMAGHRPHERVEQVHPAAQAVRPRELPCSLGPQHLRPHVWRIGDDHVEVRRLQRRARQEVGLPQLDLGEGQRLQDLARDPQGLGVLVEPDHPQVPAAGRARRLGQRQEQAPVPARGIEHPQRPPAASQRQRLLAQETRQLGRCVVDAVGLAPVGDAGQGESSPVVIMLTRPSAAGT